MIDDPAPARDGQVADEQAPGAAYAPGLALPKGGGAIRGLDEKFAANPVTGTASLTVPLASSAGRSGFGPQLALAYDSAAGNGPFGFGWSLSLPAITRKTDKGLPLYDDAADSDVFILSGAEDLVPILDAAGNRVEDTDSAPGFTIQRYRPRIEGLFARIERWTRQADGDVHWRSLSRDNSLTVYGADAGSRIADSADPRHIFSWLICETRDDKGNAVVYTYKPEDGAGVDPTHAHERRRGSRDDPRRATNRYLKRIRYGNRSPLLDEHGRRPRSLTAEQIDAAVWMFEVVFDYGEHDLDAPIPTDAGTWAYRVDPFSTYRATFEVRTTRLCRRVLAFHHFDGEPDVGNDCLVRSTDFTYSEAADPTTADRPVYTFLLAVTQAAYRRTADGYMRRSMPELEFEYTEPVVTDTVRDVDPAFLDDLPAGVDGAQFQWTDLHGEGVSGIFSEDADSWYYKRNLSPIADGGVRLEPAALVAEKPRFALAGGFARFMDVDGDGRLDFVMLDGPSPGYYEHDDADGWRPFQTFASRLDRNPRDPNLKFVDLDGDGRPDVLIAEDDAFVWHSSMGEDGFGPEQRVPHTLDEERGPTLVFADGTDSVYLADLSGDGLTDLVRIRNGEISYWPNEGYGRFGEQVAMDDAPHFDLPDQFDPRRLQLADIDGTGTTDLVYLHADGVDLYFNQSGNSWSARRRLQLFPRPDTVSNVSTVDLLGNGTACLVWSSPLPGETQRPLRYVDLMGGQKPHLLVKTANNLGAERKVVYAPSTKFYLEDRRDGTPWITRLPFPVHVVERTETYDRLSRNRFVTRYAYHHGYFDSVEREFRGFGMVEQFDTETMAALSGSDTFPTGDNIDETSHTPPVLTKTWFHTGVYIGRDHISDYYAGLSGEPNADEYYREPGLSDAEARDQLLTDTILPDGLSLDEERQACRALKGAMLRQEVYARDGTANETHPYTVTEQSFTIELLQPRAGNRHAVYFTYPRESLSYHYEREPAEPRIQHTLTLEVDHFGNVLKAASVSYGRRMPDTSLPLDEDRDVQTRTFVTYTESALTNAIDGPAHVGEHRTPLPCEARTYELTGYAPHGSAGRFVPGDFVTPDPADPTRLVNVFDSEIDYSEDATAGRQRRLVEHMRTLYRKDDLSGLLALSTLESRATAGDTYKLAFTAALLDSVYVRDGFPLLPVPADVLAGAGADRGGYAAGADLVADGVFPATDPPGGWWLPSGRVLLSPGPGDTAAQELAFARLHFFQPHRYRSPFGAENIVRFDAYDLLSVETLDALENRVTVGERLPNGDPDPAVPGNDYRVLQPIRLTDPNGNRTAVAFDTLGLVVGTAVMGKRGENAGGSLDGFEPDLSDDGVLAHLADPLADPNSLLGPASTRVVYDLFAYRRTREDLDPQPGVVYTITRETHQADLPPGVETAVEHRLAYSDGFGRQIQTKSQAEPEQPGGPPRWVGSGWTIFNNKGKPVRRYEPFFSDTHRFEFGVQLGVSPVLFYDPPGRIVATLHPEHTFEKAVFDPWRQTMWDANDTVLADPRTDADIAGFVARYFAALPPGDWETWHQQRATGVLGPEEQRAAVNAEAHAETPTTAHFDGLGRTFITLVDNGPDPVAPPQHLLFPVRVALDIEGNKRSVRDADGRVAVRYAYDMLGTVISQLSIDAGTRWTLKDVAGKVVRSWDARGQTIRTEFDPMRRPVRSFLLGDAGAPDQERLTERLVYGEQHPEAEIRNLRNRLYLQLDQAWALATEEVDFKGNVTRTSRRFAVEYKQTVVWSAVDAVLPADASTTFDPGTLDGALSPLLDDDDFVNTTTYDALNRPLSAITPHTAAMQPSTIRPEYNEAGLLERLDVRLRGDAAWTPFITDIDYDAKGRRSRIEYGNGVSTTFEYDSQTFRPVRIESRRNAARFPGDCPQPPAAGWPGCNLQSLRYTYDPVGNIVQIRDEAQQAIFFRNRRVEPASLYTYDATYRLIEATGREHLGQLGTPVPSSYDDSPRVGIDWSANDGNAVGAYVERYVYDAVGNFVEMQHRGSDPVQPGWTRRYTYEDESNRLAGTTVGDGNPPADLYVHDANGNMIRMPHLGGVHPAANLYYNARDHLRQADLGGGGTAYYASTAAGERVRKVWEKTPTVVEERLYLGAFEIFRSRHGANRLERESLHVMDDQQLIALVETRTLDTAGDDPGPAQLVRFQIGNHLASSTLELDDTAQIISYEEYTPYGSTSYQAVRSQTETPKRYRYSGKERDNETGLYYFGKRYYPPWLGRWASCDPAGIADGTCLYAYSRNEPTNLVDRSGAQAGPWGGYVWGRQLEQEVSAIFTPIFESAPVQIASGASDALAETVVGVFTSAGDRLQRTVDEVSAHPEYLAGGPLGIAAASTVAEVRHSTGELQQRAAAQGGGARGWYVAVNQQYNPAYGIFEHGDAAIQAGRRGDWHGVGHEGTGAAISVVETVAIADGVAGAVDSAVSRAAAPRPAAPRPRPAAVADAAPAAVADAAPAAVADSAPSAVADSAPARTGGAADSAPARAVAADAALSPAQILTRMEEHVAAANSAVETAIRSGDRAYFQNLGMSSRQIDVLMNPRGRTFAAQYGNAMERAVSQAFSGDAQLSGMVVDARNAGGSIFPTRSGGGRSLRPDFGVTSGPLEGSIVDLTTAGGRAGKMAKYHDRVITLEYTRPTF